jgi:hypothetical protein
MKSKYEKSQYIICHSQLFIVILSKNIKQNKTKQK